MRQRRADTGYSRAEREKGKKQSAEEGASSGASGAEDELLNTKDLNFFGDASVIGYAPALSLYEHQHTCPQCHCDATWRLSGYPLTSV